jgi:hypothetical protein
MRPGLKRRDMLLAACASAGLSAWPVRAADGESPLAVARRLAAIYPVKPSLGYVSALILSAQRRLHAQGQLPPASQALLRGWRDAAKAGPLPADWPQRAGFAVFAESARVDGDGACHDLARQAVLSAVEETPMGPRLSGLRPWTDDLFMATLLVDRSLPLLTPPEQARVAEALAGTLAEGAAQLQRADGLFNHAVGSPVAWGRGNGFAALALAWALAGPLRRQPESRLAPLRERLLAHLRALGPLQSESGLWRQVLDVADTTPELTVTAMSIAALGVAVREKWLPPAPVQAAIARGWAAIAARVDAQGGFRDVCASTPAGATTDFYRQRPMVQGADERASALVLWAALSGPT